MGDSIPRADGLSYLVCATQRSGSTLLCELLKGTEVAGVPDEFFEGLRATGIPRQPRQYFEAPEVRRHRRPARAARSRADRSSRASSRAGSATCCSGARPATACSAPR